MGTDIYGVFQAKKDGKWVDIETRYDFDRDYALFDWLAGARSDDIQPIAEARWLPDDFEVDKEGYHNEIFMGQHYHSWLLADEILNTVPPMIENIGYITEESFEKWDKKSRLDKFFKLLCFNNSDAKRELFVKVSWLEDGKIRFWSFLSEVKRLKDIHGEVRFVFGFDS